MVAQTHLLSSNPNSREKKNQKHLLCIISSPGRAMLGGTLSASSLAHDQLNFRAGLD